jgi:hypothetical protein
MRSVMSSVDPFGTWQYAQSVCFPVGARDGSKRLCCATRTNGRSGCRPRHTADSDAEMSSNEPPRWTVPARKHSAARHGTGPSSA